MSDLSQLLDDVGQYVTRYVVLSPEQAAAVALWAAHTHALNAADTTPYLAIGSAEKQSGKTRLLEVLDTVVARPWLTGRTSAAALVRKLDHDEPPTLLLDESDAAFGSGQEYAEALRGVLNSGYKRNGVASLCVGPNHDVRDFRVFSPKAIAGIGKLPDTVTDRSISIELRRRTVAEPVEKFRMRDVEMVALDLRSALEHEMGILADALREARPEMPEGLSDRAEDVWEPLLAIADAAGEGWPGKARAAAQMLNGGDVRDEDSLGVRLLSDLRVVFDEAGEERRTSADVIVALAAMADSPWGDWRGKWITPQAVSKLLQPFRIRTRQVWVDGKNQRGWERDQFRDAWARYLPPEPTHALEALDTLGPVRDGKPGLAPLASLAPDAAGVASSVGRNEESNGRSGGDEPSGALTEAVVCEVHGETTVETRRAGVVYLRCGCHGAGVAS
jgi:hypothetical protein